MRIAVIGAGRIGGNVATQLARAGHELTVAFARDQERLAALADEIGGAVAEPADAVAGAEVVVVAVPWSVLPVALEAMGSLEGRIVVDTTNPYGDGPKPAAGQTASAFNAARMENARYTKSFNTLTAAFQVQTAHREPPVVQWLCGDDADAKSVVAGLIEDAGYVPVDLGRTDESEVMEAPRRPGAVYGEEYREGDAREAAGRLDRGEPLPPTPDYRLP